MPSNETTSFVELTTGGFALLADAFAAATRRNLNYAKSIFEITTRPYSATTVAATVRENFDRANQIASLAIGELQATGHHAGELAEQIAAHNVKFAESVAASYKGAVDTGASNLNYSKENVTSSFDEMMKRFEAAQIRPQNG